MATYDYLKPEEALARAGEHARDFEKIIGLRGMDAENIRPRIARTRAGYMHPPTDTWRAHGCRNKMREIVSVVRSQGDGSGEDADPGTVTVTFRNADGTHESTYLHKFDLLCVERPVGVPVEGDGRDASAPGWASLGDVRRRPCRCCN